MTKRIPVVCCLLVVMAGTALAQAPKNTSTPASMTTTQEKKEEHLLKALRILSKWRLTFLKHNEGPASNADRY